MSKTRNLQRMYGIAILATLFGTSAAYAQSAQSSSGAEPPAVGRTTGGPTSGNSSAKSTSGSSGDAAKSVSRADQKLMQEMAYANLSEIAAGKMALEQSQNEKVKTFAQKMIDDHTKAQDELKQLADAKGVKLKEEPDAKHKAAAKMMSALKGDKFDKAYLGQGGLRDHKNTHKLLAKVEKNAKDPELQALAQKTMPVVDEHLTMAQDIANAKSASGVVGSTTDGASKSSGSSGTSGSSSSSGPAK